jgi:hypothetical protein
MTIVKPPHVCHKHKIKKLLNDYLKDLDEIRKLDNGEDMIIIAIIKEREKVIEDLETILED